MKRYKASVAASVVLLVGAADHSEEHDTSPEGVAILIQQLSRAYPNMAAMVQEISHDPESVVGQGREDQFEFEFALDLLLDGLERMRGRPSGQYGRS